MLSDGIKGSFLDVEPNYYVDPIPNVVPEGGIHYELAQSDNLYEHCIYISC